MNEVKERPILFNGEMVRAILDGRKTQTRRVIKKQPKGEWAAPGRTMCPFGKIGDRLYVRETVRPKSWGEDYELRLEYKADNATAYPAGSETDKENDQMTAMIDRAIDNIEVAGYEFPEDESPVVLPDGVWPVRWTPSIHAPKWASRIMLEITDIRVERLRNITRADAASEGMCFPDGERPDWVQRHRWPEENFRTYWDMLSKPETDSRANPWVWVIEFKRVVG